MVAEKKSAKTAAGDVKGSRHQGHEFPKVLVIGRIINGRWSGAGHMECDCHTPSRPEKLTSGRLSEKGMEVEVHNAARRVGA